MGTFTRIGIVLLVGFSFAGGLLARAQYEHRAENMAIRKKTQQVPMFASADGAGNVDFSPVQTLYEVLRNLREHYVEQLTSEEEGKMTYDALRSMLGALKDPNTRFLEPAQKKVLADEMDGKFHGIGAILSIKTVKASAMTNEHLIVVSALPGGPAASAGLKTGDDIVAVNDKIVLSFDPFQKIDKMVKDSRNSKIDPTALRKQFEVEQKRIENGILIIEAENMLMSEDKKSIELTILPKGSSKETKVKLQPGEFSVEPVSSKLLDDGYGYIKVSCFTSNTAERFASAMKDMQGKDLKGLVLDLRDLAGGETATAVQMAKWFVPGHQLAVVARSRDRKIPIKVPAPGTDEVWRKPLVVLVNRGTAQLSEVLASALKDNGAARLVGERTFGDFSEITLVDQVDGSAYTLTTGAFLSAKGVSHGGKGLSVDAEVASVSRDEDNQLKEAVKMLGTTKPRS